MKPSFSISVRALVEHVLRSGDLSTAYVGSASAVEGIRAHQRIQRQRPADYQAEVPVQHTVEQPDFILNITGRVDGLFNRTGGVIIEEIKSTLRPLKEIEDAPNEVHWGQAQCYAYIYALYEALTEIDVQLTYVHLESEKTLTLTRRWDIDALAGFFEDLITRYGRWMAWLSSWNRTRNSCIADLPFPFPDYRPGQRDMAVAAYRAIRDERHLLVQAATGIGKTMAVLYPGAKALGEGLTGKLIFLTARTTGRLAAEAALLALGEKGLRLKWVSLTAKEKICFSPENACTPDECPYAKGFFDRLNAALEAALGHDALTRDTIERLARQHRICPFEFSLELVNWADCVIGDYNYAFDPTVRLRRLFDDGGGRYAVLVDEAHNLIDRAREMFSAQLSKQPFLELRRVLKDDLPGLYRALGRINSWMASLRRQCQEAGGTVIESEAPDDLVARLHVFTRAADRWLRLNNPKPYRDDLLQLYFGCVRFMRVAEQYGEGYATIAASTGVDLRIKLFCLDPSTQLTECWERCRAAVLFSATLAPGDYFQSVLGCSHDTRRINLASPFPRENMAVFVATGISTLYRRREASRWSVASAISDMVQQRSGNYLLFFPSYEYLSLIRDTFCDLHPEIDTVVQSTHMDETEREAFLSRFSEPVERTLVGFAVMGGIFGEGIDLKGERLTGAAIVGVGLPGIGTERELIKAYFDRTRSCGFEYAYQFPGINRVLQAAGRVIRSETDRGVVLLIDQRYARQDYRTLLPSFWQVRPIGTSTQFATQLKRFWTQSVSAI